MSHKVTKDDWAKKAERLDGLKAIRNTWLQFTSLSIFDVDYVKNLESRIHSAETRIRNGL